MDPRSLIAELRRRHVFRVAVGYLVVGWLVVQVAGIVFPTFGIPEWGLRLVIALVALGLPIALVLAWAFDITPEGVERTAPASRAEAPDTRSAKRPEGGLAVLPFADLSADPDGGYFADGLTEELITRTSRIPDLRVVSRTSVMRFRNGSVDLRHIAGELGVTHVLEGSVRRHRDRVRIDVRLLDALGDDHLWSESFDRDLEDVFAVQAEVTTAVADRLAGHVGDSARRAHDDPPTRDMKAYDLYLRGRFHASRRGERDLDTAVELLRRAVERDPGFGAAHASLAEAHVVSVVYGWARPTDGMPAARRAAERGVERDGRLATGWAALATVEALFDWTWDRAERHFERAVEDPADTALAHQWRANHLLVPRGRFDEAAFSLELAREVDPLSPSMAASRAALLYYRGEFADCVRACRELQEREPGFAPAHLFEGQALLASGADDDAIEALRRAHRHSGGSVETVVGLAVGQAHAGRPADARSGLAELEDRGEEAWVSPARLARIDVALGRSERALDRLEAAAGERAPELAWMAVEPQLAPLVGHPRFEALLERVGV